MVFILVFGKWWGFNLVYSFLSYYPSTIGGTSLECPTQWGIGRKDGESLEREKGRKLVAGPKEASQKKACQSKDLSCNSPDLT